MVEDEQEQTNNRVEFVLKHPGGPKEGEASPALNELPSGLLFLFYRHASKKWEGPNTFVSIDSKPAVL